MTKKISNVKFPKFKKDILLKNYTTFKIGGPAKYFFEAKNKKDLIKAIKTAQELKLDFFILGGGGNVLAADEGYDGLIIKIQNPKSEIRNKFKIQDSKFQICCYAGVSLAKLLAESLEAGATGLEWAIGIPGTVGGAIRGNAAAFGQSISDIVKKVEVLEIKPEGKLQVKSYKLQDCQFRYRDSIFKHNKKLIILSAELEMKKRDKKEIRKKIMENLKWRKEHQPLEFPSAGSVFKNPPPKQKFGGGSAGWLIEQCGLKGKKINDAQISKKHANFIINLGKARSVDVKKLINLAKKRVKQKFNIILKEEIQYL